MRCVADTGICEHGSEHSQFYASKGLWPWSREEECRVVEQNRTEQPPEIYGNTISKTVKQNEAEWGHAADTKIQGPRGSAVIGPGHSQTSAGQQSESPAFCFRMH